MGHEPGLNQREIGKFSTRDAEAYPRYEALLERVAAALEPALGDSAPDPLPLPASWREIGLVKRLRDAQEADAGPSLAQALGADLPAAIELLTGAARPILERWFETDVLRATLATDAIIGAFTSDQLPRQRLCPPAPRHGRGRRRPRRVGLRARRHGRPRQCTRRGLHRPAASKCVASRRSARSTPTAPASSASRSPDGDELDGQGRRLERRCPSDVREDAQARRRSPTTFATPWRRIDYSSASAKINLALAEPPQLHLHARRRARRRAAPSWHDAHRPVARLPRTRLRRREVRPPEQRADPRDHDADLRRCDDRARRASTSSRCSFNTRRTNWPRATGTTSRSRSATAASRCSPATLPTSQARSSIGRCSARSTWSGRSASPAATSCKARWRRISFIASAPSPAGPTIARRFAGLYLCGAASHPGGGVMGACGRNAATEILRDRA